MQTTIPTTVRPRLLTRVIRAVGCAALLASTAFTLAQEKWPPAPRLEAVMAAEDVAALPRSLVAEPLAGGDQWRCTFRYRPEAAAGSVHLVGSFNNWEHQATAMKGPDADGDWTVELHLTTGVYEYKFLVDGALWFCDPASVDLIPDGFGGNNSLLRLGQLARMRESEARLDDGKIAIVGLAHRPPGSLYVQPLDTDEVSIRYRTLAHDVRAVRLVIRGGPTQDMRIASEGPLFTYWETRVGVPEAANTRSPNVRSIEYTFVLDDGGGPAGDPHTYRYSFTTAGLFQTPDWTRDAVWYQIVLDRFRNGDPANDPDPARPWISEWSTASPWEGQDGQTFYKYYVFDRGYGGDLAGLEEKLPYLKELGINALYLNPVFKAPSYHKYDVQSYVHIDDGFGTRGDYDRVAAEEDLLDPSTWQWTETDKRFLALLDQAHALGFKVVLDAVFNHVGDRHPAFLDVRENGPRSRYADWFDVVSWQPFDYKGWAGYAHMPILRKSRTGFVSRNLKRHIFSITRRWMDPNGDGDPADGIDGWRLDVASDIPRPFWAEWRRLVKQINPDALITGEIWHRADPWLDGWHFDAVVNYEFAKIAANWIFDRQHKASVSATVGRLAELRLAYPSAATYALQNLIGSHDTDRMASMAHNPDRVFDRQNRVQDNNSKYDGSKPAPAAYARARLAALLQMTYVGTPMVYYGDEAGMWGADDPSNRKPMLWKDLQPYEQPDENAVMEDHLAFYRRVAALRNEHSALRRGAFATLFVDDAADVWAFSRGDQSERVLVVLNASDSPREVRVPLPDGYPRSWETVLGEAGTIAMEGGALAVRVPPLGGVVLAAQTE